MGLTMAATRRTACPASDSRQQPLFNVRTFVPRPYKADSFYGVLEAYGELIILREDFPRTDASHGGADDWCPVMMAKLVLIQRKHGWTDRETVQRATTDLQVKACLGLGVEQEGPSQPTLCRRRLQIQELGLVQRYERRFVELLEALELLAKDEAVAVDSFPIHGAGQVLDTFNLLGAAIGRALRRLADATGEPLAEVAARLDAEACIGRSVKGRFDVAWDDPESQRRFLAQLVATARRVQDAIGEHLGADDLSEQVTERSEAKATSPATEPRSDGVQVGLPGLLGETAPTCLDPADDEPAGPASPTGPSRSPDRRDSGAGIADKGSEALAEVSSVLSQIIEHDVAFDERGEVAGILQRAAGDRPISITDPDMRHGRKSASVLIAGFKANVVVTVLLGWILLARVFAANRHDGEDLPGLLDELEACHRLNPSSVAGDHAYGTLANHADFARRQADGGPELIARMARPTNGGRFTKDEFGVDLDLATLTCPSGHTIPRTQWATRQGQRGWLFEFGAERCGPCPLRGRCVSPTAKDDKGRSVFIVAERERLIRAHLHRRDEADFRSKLSKRVTVEHRIAAVTQCGGKQVHRFGAQAVDFDVRLSALAANLRQLGAVLRARPELKARLEALVARLRADPELRARVLAVLVLIALLTHALRGPMTSMAARRRA